MQLCQTCKGKGCEKCEFEGVDIQMTFVRGKINNRKKLGFKEYEAKKAKEIKFDKKNASRGE